MEGPAAWGKSWGKMDLSGPIGLKTTSTIDMSLKSPSVLYTQKNNPDADSLTDHHANLRKYPTS